MVDEDVVVRIVVTPAEFKRMLLIFDEYKYKRNTHKILDFEVPKEGINRMNSF